MIRQLFVAVVLIIVIFSCSKKNHDVDPADSNPYALKVGNYWIYKTDQVYNDSIIQSCQDSTYIEKDTVVRGNTYFMIVTKSNNCHEEQANLLRDSSGYLISFRGQKFHSFGHPGEEIYVAYYLITSLDTSFLGKFVMDRQDSSYSLPAGNFAGLNCKEYGYGYNHGVLNYMITASTVYAKNIGMIYSRFPFFSYQGSGFQSSLIRYKVN